MYLLDTNVISELRRRKPHGAVVAWFEKADNADLYISVVSIAEIQAGIEVTREQDNQKARELETWLDLVTKNHNILAMDTKAFRTWAKLMHRKSDTLYQDAMIASIAKTHQLTVVTRNIKDFQHFDVALLNPFDGHYS